MKGRNRGNKSNLLYGVGVVAGVGALAFILSMRGTTEGPFEVTAGRTYRLDFEHPPAGGIDVRNLLEAFMAGEGHIVSQTDTTTVVELDYQGPTQTIDTPYEVDTPVGKFALVRIREM